MKDKFNEIKRKAGEKLARGLDKAPDTQASAPDFALEEQLVGAALRGDQGAVTKLLLQGADINYKSAKSGHTALSSVISRSETGLAEFLLEHGADPRIDGKAGPLVCSADTRLIPRLMELGCNPNVADAYGTPLLRLTLSRDGDSIAAAKALLAHGADPHSRGFWGATPLGNALFAGSPVMVSLLLKAGATVETDAQGRHPEIAAARRRYDVLEQMDRNGFLPGDWPTKAECRQCLRLVEQSLAAGNRPRPPGPKLP